MGRIEGLDLVLDGAPFPFMGWGGRVFPSFWKGISEFWIGPCAILVFYSDVDILVFGEVFDEVFDHEVFKCLSSGV